MATRPIFDEHKLREEIVNIWGPAGGYVEVFDHMLSEIEKKSLQSCMVKHDIYSVYVRLDTSRPRNLDVDLYFADSIEPMNLREFHKQCNLRQDFDQIFIEKTKPHDFN